LHVADEVRDAPPHVDVILPTHCGIAWVDEAVASVLAQTHRELSLIIVDDASDDGTFAHVCERWSHDPRVTVLSLETPQRAAGARMQALETGDGEWLAFIDQDDRWRPEKLALQLRRAQASPRPDAVHTDCSHIDAAGTPLPGAARHENAVRARIAWDALSGEALTLLCFRANRIRLGSALVSRTAFEAVGGFDAALFGGEDWDFWLRFAAAGQRIAHLREPLLERRIHAQATSSARRAERIEGLYRACDLASARDPFLAAHAAARLETLLRRELESCGGRAVRARLRERGEDLAGAARARLWFSSFAAGLLPRSTQHQS
jgi:glycosyltransferase involved in cell wall biosynthesis